MESDICCPQIDPAPWDGRLFEWKDKKFIKDRVCCLFYMPMNFASVIKKLDKKIRDCQAVIPENLCLSDHTSKWNMDLYLAVDKDIPGADNTTLSGTFLSKAYEGPYKNTGTWCKDFRAYAQSLNKTIEKMYMWYTTCPTCAKKYGKNVVIIAAKVC